MRPLSRNNIIQVYAERDSVHTNPVYQRISGVWDRRKQQLFIDSMINGLDLPKLYFHELIPPRRIDDSVFRYAIIDGKQRLEAIWSFMDDEFPLADDFRFLDDPQVTAGGMKYSALATRFPHLRARFDKTDLPIITMQTDDEELVENLFARLNEAVPLTAPEYRNTLGGPIPRVLRELAIHDFFQMSLPFETGRHRYLDLAAKFLYITHEQKFVSTKKADLDDFVIRFKKGREKRVGWASEQSVSGLRTRAVSILDGMHRWFAVKDPLLTSIGWITLHFHIFRLFDRDQVVPAGGLDRSTFETFLGRIQTYRAEMRGVAAGADQRSIEIDPQLAKFDRLRQALNDGSALKTRYSILRQYILEHLEIALPAPED
jgi:hypothetical protein